MQGLRASLAAVIAAAALAGTASAQSPAADQYGPGTPPQGPPASPGQGQGNPPAQPPQNPPPDSPPGQGVAGETAEGSQGEEQSGSAPGRSGARGGAGGDGPSTSSSATAPAAPLVFNFAFGPLSDETEEDIQAAVERAGFVFEQQPLSSPDAVKEFLDSELADSFGSDPQAVGRALGAQLVAGTPLAQDAFAALFGDEAEFEPVARVVLTKDIKLSDAESKFLDGLAEGFLSTDIPLAFAEQSDADPSNAKLFEDFGVLVVDNIETEDGKADLAAILTGAVTTQEQVAIDRASAIVTEDSGGTAGTVPWVLLALLAGGAVVILRGGMKPSRRG